MKKQLLLNLFKNHSMFKLNRDVIDDTWKGGK